MMTPTLRVRPAARAAVLLLAATVALGGCSTVKGWFGGKKKDEPLAPAALTDITPGVTVTRLWKAGAGKGEGRLGARHPLADAFGEQPPGGILIECDVGVGRARNIEVELPGRLLAQ